MTIHINTSASVGRAISTLQKILVFLNVLSLDAPFVVLGWQDLMARQFDVSVSLLERLFVFLATWLAYAGDRYLDVKELPVDIELSVRHRFSQTYRIGIRWCWIAVFLITAIISIWFVPLQQLLAAGILGMLLLAYFGFCFYSPMLGRVVIPREWVVSLFVVGAAFFFPFWDMDQTSCEYCWLFLVTLWWLGTVNAFGISSWEKPIDEQLGNQTLATNWAHYERVYLCWVLCGLLFTAAMTLIYQIYLPGMVFSFLAIFWLHRQSFFTPIKPPLADLMLLIPWLAKLLWDSFH